MNRLVAKACESAVDPDDKRLARDVHLPAPYAGINRIRFNGFADGRQGLRGRHLRPFRPPQGGAQLYIRRSDGSRSGRLTQATGSGTNAHPLRRTDHRMTRRTCRLFHVDAFTRERFCGNPAVVVLDADELTDEDMHRIAREINGTEVAFVFGRSPPTTTSKSASSRRVAKSRSSATPRSQRITCARLPTACPRARSGRSRGRASSKSR